jgi:hypothetical protein
MDCDCKKSCQNWSGNVAFWSEIVAVWSGNVAVAKLKQLLAKEPLETPKKPLMSKTWFSEKRQKKGTTSEDAGIKEIQREYRNVKYVK